MPSPLGHYYSVMEDMKKFVKNDEVRKKLTYIYDNGNSKQCNFVEKVIRQCSKCTLFEDAYGAVPSLKMRQKITAIYKSLVAEKTVENEENSTNISR